MLGTTLRNTLSVSVLAVASAPAIAGSHTWDVWEVFSNADGTVQFIELHEANGGSQETGLGGHNIVASPTGTIYTILNNVSAPTTNKFYLLATAAFAALPGAPTPRRTACSCAARSGPGSWGTARSARRRARR